MVRKDIVRNPELRVNTAVVLVRGRTHFPSQLDEQWPSTYSLLKDLIHQSDDDSLRTETVAVRGTTL